MRKLLLICLLLGWLLPEATAQQQVSGTVTDGVSGEPLPGVNILLQGTRNGTITDLDGRYRLEVPGLDAVLNFSFIGYLREEVRVGDQTTIDVALNPDMQALEEVVVVGYGVQKKKLATGATLQVEGEDLQKLSTTSPLQALQGQAPGVQISSTSGQPGEGMRVRIRGVGTVGDASPLYVVDGVLTGDISYLNPADIESIDVLKDAASAAIYGSQAANGVVLVTTRQGTKGQPAKISFDTFYGLQNVARQADLLNAREYASIMNEAAVNSGKQPIFSNDSIASMGEGTNWLDEMFVENAPTQNYVLSAQGGGEASVYSLSLGYTAQEGVVGGKDLSNYERYNFRINTEHSLYEDIVKVGQHLTFAYEVTNGIGVGNQYNNALRPAFNVSPFVPMYGPDGEFHNNEGSSWYEGEANPYAQMVYTNQNDNNEQKLLGDVYLSVEPIEGLRFRTSLGVDYYAYEGRSFTPIYTLSTYTFSNFSRVNQSMGKGRTLIWDNLLSYNFDVNQVHGFDVMVGTSAIHFNGSNMSGSNINLVFDDLEHAWLDNATNTSDGTNMSLSGNPSDPDRRMSYFGRLNYNYKETYLLNTTFRADGSSRFAAGNRWGYFPSVSAGWVLSNEEFLQASQNWLSFLKFRASWGQVGNQSIPAFQYAAPITINNTNYTFGPGEGNLTPGAYPSRLANQNVRWETSEQTNLGFDARFLNGKVAVNFDWYDKTTKDWLVPAPVLSTAGADAPWINGGDVQNTGVELAISYNNYVGDFNYSVGINGAYNKNTVRNIPTEDGIIHGSANQLFDNSLEFYRAQSGFPIGYFWGLETDGIFQYEEEVALYRSGEGVVIQPDARPGDVRFVDQNDDGLINDLDRVMVGDPNPDFTFGFTFSADYKGFDLSFLASGVAGNQLVQSYRNHANRYANYTTAIFDRWHGPGSSNTLPRVTETSANWTNFSDLYIQDGDFLRISNITLGYDFGRLIKSEYVGKVRFYAAAQNLFTFTNYDGMDPEVGYGIDNGVIDNFSSGIDLGYYPRPRTLMVGANIQF